MRALLSIFLFATAPPAGAAPAATGAPAPPAELVSRAERTGFAETGRYDEVLSLCRALAGRYPEKIRCLEFGRTPEGRPLVALVAGAGAGARDAAAVRQAKRPVVLFIGGIHAGEIDGKDAGFLVLRDLAAGHGPAASSLDAVTVVFVPVFNVDGHERFGPNHRPNQRGPREGGFRATAQNLNLNRDWLKADAPEMVAMLALVADWDPAILVDLHVTDGAKFEHDVAVIVSSQPAVPAARELDQAATTLSRALMGSLAQRGHLPLPFYPAFRKYEDPTSGIEVAPSPARFSNGYYGWRNRLGVLVETHSWHPYPHRVASTRAVMEEVLRASVGAGAVWQAAGAAADRAAATLAGRPVALAWKTTPPARTIDFRGYAFTVEPSAISGAPWVRYDEKRPQNWRVELFERLAPTVTVTAPRAGGGYVVPPVHADWLGRKLALHGIRSQRLDTARAASARVPTSTFRAEAVKFATSPNEGRFAAELTGRWRPEPRAIPAGSLFVPIDQPRAPLVLLLLEPTSPESFAAWGFFHGAFEQKEYMEDYVAEEEARKMLARDPGLRKTFEAALARDPAMARDPRRRLKFFYQRHPAWDERVNLYPIVRLEGKP